MNTKDKMVTRLNAGKKVRSSGLELLKIIAVFAIIISHISKWLYEPSPYVGFNEYVFNLNLNTPDLSILFVSATMQFGAFGNRVFYLCSVWFLLDSKKSGWQKAVKMYILFYILSVSSFAIEAIIRNGYIHTELILKSILPNVLQSNWYATYYIVLCFTYPLLNKLVNKMTEKALSLTVWIFLAVMMAAFFVGFAFMPEVVLWVWMYLAVAYFKRYKKEFCDNLKVNLIILISAIILCAGFKMLINYLGMQNILFKDQLLFFNINISPFTLVIAFTAMNVFRKMTFKSRFINYISSLTFLIYLTHANLIFRLRYIPEIFRYVYAIFGHNKLFLTVMTLSIALLVASTLVSIVIKHTLDLGISKLVDKVVAKVKERNALNQVPPISIEQIEERKTA